MILGLLRALLVELKCGNVVLMEALENTLVFILRDHEYLQHISWDSWIISLLVQI